MGERKQDRRDAILTAARKIVRRHGPDALTFDAVADAVGISKQAVLYWYPNKARLIEAIVRPALEAEAAAALGASTAGLSPQGALRTTLEALAVFHLADLDRFRLMYVAPQIGRRSSGQSQSLTTLGRIHPATVKMYDALAKHLIAAGRVNGERGARRQATALHTALLGLILRLAMADALNAPLKREEGVLVDALLDIIAPDAA